MTTARSGALIYFALKGANLGAATIWSFALIFVLIRRMPLADYSSVVVVTALGAYLMACDLGMSSAVYARMRAFWLRTKEANAAAPTFATSILIAYIALSAVASAVFAVVAHALPIGTGDQAGALSVYFATLSLALPWSVVRALLGASDRFMAFEIVEFARRTLNLALVVALFWGLPFLAYGWLSIAGWLLAIVALRKPIREMTQWTSLRTTRGWRDAFAGQGKLMGSSGNFSLIEFLAFNFPYLVLPLVYGASHVIVAFDVFSKITRFGSQANIMTFEALLPTSTRALHAGEHARWRRIVAVGLAISLTFACIGTVFVLPFGDMTFGLLLGDSSLVPQWLRICMTAMLFGDAFRAGGALLMLSLGKVQRLLPICIAGAVAFLSLIVIASSTSLTFSGFMISYVAIFGLTSLLYYRGMIKAVRPAAQAHVVKDSEAMTEPILRPQIVIPMSGFGERFRRAGYALPKPLIPIDGMPIIEHVVGLFPGEKDITFICNQDHLDNPDYGMRDTLRRICPSGQIVGIAPHKLGPVHAVLQVADQLDPMRPVVVNYCDFSCFWNWERFLEFVRASRCDGALPAYRGFHPHSLGTTNYAYMREMGGWLLDIQEKQPFTDDRMQEFASSGTYYFRTAALMADAFRAIIRDNIQVGGEFYVSLAYKDLLRRGMSVAVYELQHFLQWGTPDDVREYEGWSGAFEALTRSDPPSTMTSGVAVFPMAGLGERFSKEGYTVAKPLIEVSGAPMALQAARDLPNVKHQAFVLRADMPGVDSISASLSEAFPGAVIERIAGVTRGQACTAEIGLKALATIGEGVRSAPLTFGVCDAGVLFDEKRLSQLLQDGTDLIVWTRRGHPHATRNPQMYGWISEVNGRVEKVSVKVPLSEPANDPIIVGIFTFRNAEVFERCFTSLVARDGSVNGEFYLDSCVGEAVALGMTCRTLELDAYFSWGTPNDLKTFEYWQSCFSKLPWHPYELAKDRRIDARGARELTQRYAAVDPSTSDLANMPDTL